MKNISIFILSLIATLSFNASSSVDSQKPRVGQFVFLKGVFIENGVSQKAQKLVKVSAFDKKTMRFFVYNKTTFENGQVLDESYHQSVSQLEDYYRTLSAIEGICGNIGGFNEVIEGPGGTALSTCHFQRYPENGTIFSWFSSQIPLGIVKLEEIDKVKRTELHLQIADYKW